MPVPSVDLCSVAFADDVVLPDGQAKKIVEGNCADCHGRGCKKISDKKDKIVF